MKPTKIRLFIKTQCPWCLEAMAWLRQHHLAFETLDVLQDPNALREMVVLSRQTLAPVIEVDGQVLADFDTGQLEVFWKKLGYDF